MQINRKGLSRAFTLVEVMIVASVIGLLATITVPNYVRAREVAWRNICINNLKKMDAAKTQAALDLRWSDGVGAGTLGNPLYKDTVARYLQSGTRPVCPTGVDCFFMPIGENPVCSSGIPDHRIDFTR